MTVTRRCYSCDHAEAEYEARLDHDTTPVVLLCDPCAIWERDAGSVLRIRTLATSPHVTATDRASPPRCDLPKRTPRT